MFQEAMTYHDERGQYHVHRWHDLPDSDPRKRWHFWMSGWHFGQLGRLYNERDAARRAARELPH